MGSSYSSPERRELRKQAAAARYLQSAPKNLQPLINSTIQGKSLNNINKERDALVERESAEELRKMVVGLEDKIEKGKEELEDLKKNKIDLKNDLENYKGSQKPKNNASNNDKKSYASGIAELEEAISSIQDEIRNSDYIITEIQNEKFKLIKAIKDKQKNSELTRQRTKSWSSAARNAKAFFSRLTTRGTGSFFGNRRTANQKAANEAAERKAANKKAAAEKKAANNKARAQKEEEEEREAKKERNAALNKTRKNKEEQRQKNANAQKKARNEALKKAQEAREAYLKSNEGIATIKKLEEATKALPKLAIPTGKFKYNSNNPFNNIPAPVGNVTNASSGGSRRTYRRHRKGRHTRRSY